METYYSVIVAIVIMLMVADIVNLLDNESLRRETKKRLIIIACLIIVGITCEFLGLWLNGKEAKVLHSMVKALEYSITPCIPFLYARITNIRKKWQKNVIKLLLAIHAIVEFANIKWNIVFYINDNNIHCHGQYYFIYICAYCVGVMIFLITILEASLKYQSKNLSSLASIVGFTVLGLLIRLVWADVNTDWLIVAISFNLFVIYFSDLVLKVDSLTGLLNRTAYVNYLEKVERGRIKTAIIMLDVNRFKEINDTLGHKEGDECLKFVAKIIRKAYEKYAYCFRIGGDEFCMIFKPYKFDELIEEWQEKEYEVMKKNLENFNNLLSKELDKRIMKKNSIDNNEHYEKILLQNKCAQGFGIFNPPSLERSYIETKEEYSFVTVGEAIKWADDRMYENKKSGKK